MNCPICGEPIPDGGTCPRHGAARRAPDGQVVPAALVANTRRVTGRHLLDLVADGEDAPRDSVGPAMADTAVRDPLVGARIGEYLVRRRIGSGGMGVVYEGWQPVIERRVAIKMLRPELSGSEAASGLLREARAANAVQHRGIVEVFGFGELNGAHYLVMQYLEGRSVEQVLVERGALEPEEAIRILDEVLAALSAAHGKGVIHRDLKPSNVFLVDEPGGNYVKILDFGLAKRAAAPNAMARPTHASMMVGTPQYIAPEQATGQPVGPPTDLYSLGVMAFELVTGKLPFEGDSPIATALLHVNAPPPDPCAAFPAIPRSLGDLILQMLAKDPAARPPSAEAVRSELRRIRRELMEASTQPRRQLDDRPTLRDQSTAETPREPDPAPAQTPIPLEHLAAARRGRLRPWHLGLVAAGGLAVGGAYLFLRPAEQGPPIAAAIPFEVPEVPPPKTPVEPAVPVAPPASPPPQTPSPAPGTVPPGAAVNAVTPPDAPVQPERPSKPKTGDLALQVEGGWAFIYLDGVQKGRAPGVNRLALAPGAHTLELKGNEHRAPYRATIRIEAGRTLSHVVQLRSAEVPVP